MDEKQPDSRMMVVLMVLWFAFCVFAALMGWVTVGCDSPEPQIQYVYVDSLGNRYAPMSRVDSLKATLCRVGDGYTRVIARLDSCLGGPIPSANDTSGTLQGRTPREETDYPRRAQGPPFTNQENDR